jgi:hypothetical protein
MMPRVRQPPATGIQAATPPAPLPPCARNDMMGQRQATLHGEETLSDNPSQDSQRRRVRWPELLLLVPFFAVLWVPFYNSVEPQLGGIPFFYWYQFLWIVISAGLTLLAYLTGE